MSDVRADERLEALVLGTWVSNEQFRAAWKPEPDLFYFPPAHAVAEVFESAWPVKRWNEIFTLSELEKRGKLPIVGGKQRVLELLGGPVLPNPLADVDKLKELRSLRNLRKCVREVEGSVDSGARLSQVQERMRAAMDESIAGIGTPLVTGRELMATLADDLRARTPVSFCTTGFRDLDSRTGGLRSGWVALAGSDTSWGKTAWSAMLIDKNLMFGKRILVVSTEDPLVAYRDRVICRRAGVSFTHMRDRDFNPYEIERIVRYGERFEDGLFFISGEGVPVETLAGQICAACAAHKIHLVIVDYVHATETERDFRGDRPQEIRYIGRAYTNAIKKSRAAGLMFAQLTMPPEGRRPTKESVRDCKDLIKAAEIVLIGYEEQGLRKISIEKAKFGRKGMQLDAPWDTRTANFIDDIGQQLELDTDDEAAA